MPRSLHFPFTAHARIHTFLPIPAHDRAQKGERGLRSHVQRGLRVVEAGPVIARSMSPSDQDVSTTPAMRRCNLSRSPFVSGSLHFYMSPHTGGPQSLHLYASGALTGQDRPAAGARIPAFSRVPATRGAQIPAFLRVRRSDRPKPSPGGSPDPCIFPCPRARECPDPCIFTGPDAGRRRNPSTGATPGAVAPRPASDARGPVKMQGKRPSRVKKRTVRTPQSPPVSTSLTTPSTTIRALFSLSLRTHPPQAPPRGRRTRMGCAHCRRPRETRLPCRASSGV